MAINILTSICSKQAFHHLVFQAKSLSHPLLFSFIHFLSVTVSYFNLQKCLVCGLIFSVIITFNIIYLDKHHLLSDHPTSNFTLQTLKIISL